MKRSRIEVKILENIDFIVFLFYFIFNCRLFFKLCLNMNASDTRFMYRRKGWYINKSCMKLICIRLRDGVKAWNLVQMEKKTKKLAIFFWCKGR